MYELPSDVFNLSHRTLSTYEVIEALREFYPDLETTFVDQHIPRKSLTMARDECLQSMVQDIAKFRELFTF